MSREVNLFVQSLAKDCNAYEKAMLLPLNLVQSQGHVMLSYVRGWVRATADNARLITFLEWKNVPIVTCTYSGIADVLEQMMIQYQSPIALAWLQRKDGMFQYSIRTDGTIHAADVAKLFNGGGHPKAAGFQTHSLFPWEGMTLDRKTAASLQA